jgi:hypothetical protein
MAPHLAGGEYEPEGDGKAAVKGSVEWYLRAMER